MTIALRNVRFWGCTANDQRVFIWRAFLTPPSVSAFIDGHCKVDDDCKAAKDLSMKKAPGLGVPGAKIG
jgi:hypothetical protein